MVIFGLVTPPIEGLVYSAENVQLRIEQQTIGKGSVYISQNSLIWKPSNEQMEGISIFWKCISLHGIANAPTKSIYFVIDRQFKWPGSAEGGGANNPVAMGNGSNGQSEVETNGDGDDDSESDEEEIFEDAEEDQITECWLLPDDVNVVDTMYQAMTECQALHPDSEDSISGDSDLMEDDEDDDNGEYDDAGEFISTGNGNGGADVDAARANMNNLSLDDDRFADADE